MKQVHWIVGLPFAIVLGGFLAHEVLVMRRSMRHYRPSALTLGMFATFQLQELDEILRSRNDNDPRLDKDFNTMSPEAKRLFRRKYGELPPEKRNERGTIVYILGKNIADAQDWEFVREVASEPPCLSLADCSKKGTGPSGLGDDVTLAYPSLVALKAAQNVIEKDPANKDARSVIAAARSSKAPAVQRLVAKLDRQFPN